MAINNRDAVRLRISDKSLLTREVADGMGSNKIYRVQHAPVVNNPPMQIWVNNVAQVLTTDYTLDEANGVVTFVVTPPAGQEIIFQYYWSVWSDVDLDYFVANASDNVLLASANVLLAWAADAAKIAKRETLQGGPGLGLVTRDTSVAARELREMAKMYLDLYNRQDPEGLDAPADGITEVPWTEQTYNRMLDQEIIREG